jgi:hypothetical protein
MVGVGALPSMGRLDTVSTRISIKVWAIASLTDLAEVEHNSMTDSLTMGLGDQVELCKSLIMQEVR